MNLMTGIPDIDNPSKTIRIKSEKAEICSYSYQSDNPYAFNPCYEGSLNTEEEQAQNNHIKEELWHVSIERQDFYSR